MSTNLLSFCYFELVYRKRKKIYFCLFCFISLCSFLCYGNFHICEAKILSLRNFMVFFSWSNNTLLKNCQKFFFNTILVIYLWESILLCIFNLVLFNLKMLFCIIEIEKAYSSTCHVVLHSFITVIK